MFYSVALLCLFLSGVFSSDVLVFTDKDFDYNIKQHKIILVEFYAPWCGHCKKLAPEYEEAATKLKSTDPIVSLAKVDCTVETKVCGDQGVSGYPTLKVFKDGAFAFDYSGPRSASGIVSYMLSKAGPPSYELKNEAELEKIKGSAEMSFVVGCFSSKDEKKFETFMTVATSKSDDYKFAHSFDSVLCEKLGLQNTFGIQLPLKLKSKFEDMINKFTKDFNVAEIKTWLNENIMGLAGVRNQNTVKHFENRPLIIAFYNVDYEKNPKGTNYWRNRFLKVSKEVKESRGTPLYFAISNSQQMNDFKDFGFESSDINAVNIAAYDENGKKYKMTDDFSMESYKKWLNSFIDGSVEAYLKSQPIPTTSDSDVKVVVAKNFDEIVNDPTKDVLIEFYAPWCGHCKSLEPKYNELAEKLKNEPNVVIAKMDATENDVPSPYQVSGFPTIFFASKNGKKNPQQYQGGREVSDFLQFLATSATDGLKTVDKNGKKIEL